jgi:predicted ATPase
VLTGASGGGKSTVLETLATHGFMVVEEPGRRIVGEQLATGGDATPWQDRRAFLHLLFQRSLAAFEAALAMPGPVFFDRGIIEALAYSRQLGLPVPDAWLALARRRRYAEPVFVIPPWREVFRNDAERRKTWTEVLDDHRVTVAAYAALGYRMVEVPRAPVAELAAFVLGQVGIGEATGSRSP